MPLSYPAKIAVGLLTLMVITVPLAVAAFVLLSVFGPQLFPGPSTSPPAWFELGFSIMFPLMCLLSIANYAMIAFYLAHIVKNTRGSDVLRIILAIAVFFFPFFGMPAYYFIFVLPQAPPAWALAQLPQPNKALT
jgi:hypothetical protein